jgi:VWFA-related protein
VIRGLIITICSFLALSASAEVWSTDLDAALVRAEREQKLVLLHLRPTCSACNEFLDFLIVDAAQHGGMQEAYRQFILVRADEKPVTPAIANVLQQKPRRPSILLVDPGGRILEPLKDFQTPNGFLDFLTLARQQAPRILYSAALRKKGETADADFVLADSLLRMEQVEQARDLFNVAARGYDRVKKPDLAELAKMNGAFAEYFASVRARHSVRAQQMVISLLRYAQHPMTPANGARAWLAVGAIRQMEKDTGGAIRAYRASYELAAPGSSTRQTARQNLEQLGDTWAAAQEVAATATTTATIRLVPPPRSTISGKAEFIANTSPAVARVAFLVDGVQAATVGRAPFRARLDVGALPRLRTVRAIAYDKEGKSIGETEVTINDRVDDAFRVAILSPSTDRIEGNVVAEAEANAPAGRGVKAVELFWNEEKLGTFADRPYRAAFVAPGKFGYLRAVATLDDGRTAEDTRVYNADVASETVEVHAIGFAATVADAKGKRIGGLAGKDFVVKENGSAVAVSDRVTDEPATIALAIDTSRSMRSSLNELFDAATAFIDATAKPDSRVFIVAFDSVPRVIHPPSSDAASLRKSVLSLYPTGATAAVDAVTFALQQFRGIGGRRALVLLTDGHDGPNSQSTAAAMRMAMETGVPIYIVIPHIYRGSRLGNGLLGVSAATGGLQFPAARPEEMPSIFAKIREEVMGQYLLSIAGSAGNGEWRRIEVQVPGRREAKVRTIGGYYAR